MKSVKKKKISLSRQDRLSNLEDQVARKGVHIHYDVLEAAGLKLKGGICKIKGEYHLFVDRRQSMDEKIDILQDLLSRPLPKIVPEGPV